MSVGMFSCAQGVHGVGQLIGPRRWVVEEHAGLGVPVQALAQTFAAQKSFRTHEEHGLSAHADCPEVLLPGASI